MLIGVSCRTLPLLWACVGVFAKFHRPPYFLLILIEPAYFPYILLVLGSFWFLLGILFVVIFRYEVFSGGADRAIIPSSLRGIVAGGLMALAMIPCSTSEAGRLLPAWRPQLTSLDCALWVGFAFWAGLTFRLLPSPTPRCPLWLRLALLVFGSISAFGLGALACKLKLCDMFSW